SRGRVLPGAQVRAAAPADLGTVSSRAARSIVVSAELIEAATRDGYEAGFTQGFQEGYAEGIGQAAQHTQLLGGLVQRLSQAADALMVRETTARHDVESEVVATAVQIAAVLVGHALAQPDTRGRDAIAR